MLFSLQLFKERSLWFISRSIHSELTKKRDKLQEQVYLKNPETAYLVSNEKFDEKIEEMGVIGPEDAVTIAGMYAERAAYQMKQWFMKLFSGFHWNCSIMQQV